MSSLSVASVLACLLLVAASGAQGEAVKPAAPSEPVPEVLEAPKAPRVGFEVPLVHSTADARGESIVLSNCAMAVTLRVDSSKQVSITSIRSESGKELLGKPASCFSIVNGDGTPFKDGATFRVDKWHSWLHNSYAEVQLCLLAPEPVVWRLRLYRDKRYLEQRFELPAGWRTGDRAVLEVLPTAAALRPVMPVNTMKRGFKKAASNAPGRNKFEFVEQCEHLVYDPAARCGLAAFVAGVGGEEKMTLGEVKLLDHATPAIADNDPVARIVIFPFEGAVDKGFYAVRKFIADEYACQGEMYSQFLWNQFWLWQGKHADWGYQECTAARLLAILPHLSAIGVEAFHIDAGWEKGKSSTPRQGYKDWQFDPDRFPEGFVPIKKYLREHGMSYVTHLFTAGVNDPQIVTPLTEDTDLDKLFIDANANEQTLACIRAARKQFPGLELFVHSMNDARRATSYWRWGNMHYLSDFNQVYFGEGTWAPYMKDIPPETTTARFIDLFTRCASYQATWVWPFKSILPPHAGYCMGGMPWYTPQMDVKAASSLILTTIAARCMFEWGDDPRVDNPDVVQFFLDWVAFWKSFRPYLQEYQHVMSPPDGIHLDGVAHMKGNEGFMILFNPATKEQKVSLKELLWSPELELDPRKRAEITDWTKPLEPVAISSVDLLKPRGDIRVGPQGYRVIGVNLDLEGMKAEVKRQRSLIHWPPK